MTKLSACVQEVSHSNVTVGDRGSKYRANFPNPSNVKFRKAHVDGCIVTDGARADWIVSKVGVGSVIVELKGKDVAHACEQLFSTLSHADCQEWLEAKKALLVVCSRVPSFDTSIAKAQVRARKAGVRLKASCGGGNFSVEELLAIKPA
jgi:hypothetical protein